MNPVPGTPKLSPARILGGKGGRSPPPLGGILLSAEQDFALVPSSTRKEAEMDREWPNTII